MAELIDKSAIFPNGEFLVDENNPMASVGELINRISNLPTVTEAEIRNKAIDEFAEKILENAYDYECMRWSNDVMIRIWESTIDEIAEQLKGE